MSSGSTGSPMARRGKAIDCERGVGEHGRMHRARRRWWECSAPKAPKAPKALRVARMSGTAWRSRAWMEWRDRFFERGGRRRGGGGRGRRAHVVGCERLSTATRAPGRVASRRSGEGRLCAELGTLAIAELNRAMESVDRRRCCRSRRRSLTY